MVRRLFYALILIYSNICVRVSKNENQVDKTIQTLLME